MPTRRFARKCALTSPPPYTTRCCRNRRCPHYPRSFLPRLWRSRGCAPLTLAPPWSSSHRGSRRVSGLTSSRMNRTPLAPLARESVLRSEIIDRRADIDHDERARWLRNVSSGRIDEHLGMMRSVTTTGAPITRLAVLRKSLLHSIATTFWRFATKITARRDNRRPSLRTNFRLLEKPLKKKRLRSNFNSGSFESATVSRLRVVFVGFSERWRRVPLFRRDSRRRRDSNSMNEAAIDVPHASRERHSHVSQRTSFPLNVVARQREQRRVICYHTVAVDCSHIPFTPTLRRLVCKRGAYELLVDQRPRDQLPAHDPRHAVKLALTLGLLYGRTISTLPRDNTSTTTYSCNPENV